MSHIPSTAMPHAHAHDDNPDGESRQPAGTRPDPEPTTATPERAALWRDDARRAAGEAPFSSAGPGTATGNRTGGAADATAAKAGATGSTDKKQPAVDGTVTAQDADKSDDAARVPRRGRSPLGVAALALGGLAVFGGVAAVLFPRKDDGKKPKKRKKAKKA